MAYSIFQPKLNLTKVKEEPLDSDNDVIYQPTNILMEVKEEPEEYFTIQEVVEVKQELLQNPSIANILNEHNYFMSITPDYKSESFESNAIQRDEDGIEYEEVDLFETEMTSIDKIPTKNENPLKCPECPTVLEDTLRLNRHMRLHRLPQFKCRNCLKMFKRKSTLHNHHCDLKCPICPDICVCRDDPSSANCRICLKIDFRYFEDYKMHMLDYHNEVVICKTCERNKYTLFKHKQQGHVMQKMFKCSLCEVILKTKELRDAHVSSHSKVFECPECDKKFTRKAALEQHMILHIDPDFYRCQHCNKSFRGKFCLKNHIKVVHDEERTKKRELELLNGYVSVDREGWRRCMECPLLFRSQESLNRHGDQAHSMSVRYSRRNVEREEKSVPRFATKVVP